MKYYLGLSISMQETETNTTSSVGIIYRVVELFLGIKTDLLRSKSHRIHHPQYVVKILEVSAKYNYKTMRLCMCTVCRTAR